MLHSTKGSNLSIDDPCHENFEPFKPTFSVLCLEKPISRRVSRGLSEALWIFVGVGFFLGGKVAMLSSALRAL